MQQTPIENLIEAVLRTGNVPTEVMKVLLDKQFIDYEKQYIRDVAEKAWDASEAHLGAMFLPSLKLNHPNKETYINNIL